MSNKEGYSDKTAETAIRRVVEQERAMKKGGKKSDGNERCTKIEKSQEIRQHSA